MQQITEGKQSTYCACARSGGQNIGTTATTIDSVISLKIRANNISCKEVGLLTEYMYTHEAK